MHPLLLQRSLEAEQAGAGVLDSVHVTLSCRRCNDFLDSPDAETVRSAEYRDVDGLVAQARTRAAAALARTPGACPRCGGKTAPVAVDYHTFHSAMGRDLVVRAQPKLFGLDTELLWFAPTRGYQPTGLLTEKQRHVVRRDAAFRRIRAALDRGGIRAAVGAIEEALQSFRGDPELLAYAPRLLGAGKTDLVGHLAALHVTRNPTDADGYFWLAMAIWDNVNRGALTARHLEQAEAHLHTALRLRAEFADAECALCRLARARGDHEGARGCFQRALEKYPANPQLLLDFATLQLGRDPAGALDCFTRGETLAPDDPEFPFGRARALARLGRTYDAEVALARGRSLSPAHPRLRETELAVRRARGNGLPELTFSIAP